MKKKMMVTIVIVITMAISLMTGCGNTAKVPEEVQPEEELIEEVEEAVEETAVTVERELLKPAMIKVEDLPEWLKESDLENGFISTHKLMEIAKKMGKDLELEADGKVYTIKPNMVLHGNVEVIAEEPEKKENTEEEIETAETPVETAVESPSLSAQTTPSQPAQQTPPQQTSSQPSQPAHEHNWVAVTEQVWVEDKAAWDETVLVKEAWDEETVTYEWQWVNIGYKTGDGKMWDTEAEAEAHMFTLPVAQRHYSTIADEVQVPITTTVHHDAEYTTVHHDATGHYEDVTTGYKCSSCGAQK